MSSATGRKSIRRGISSITVAAAPSLTITFRASLTITVRAISSRGTTGVERRIVSSPRRGTRGFVRTSRIIFSLSSKILTLMIIISTVRGRRITMIATEISGRRRSRIRGGREISPREISSGRLTILCLGTSFNFVHILSNVDAYITSQQIRSVHRNCLFQTVQRLEENVRPLRRFVSFHRLMHDNVRNLLILKQSSQMISQRLRCNTSHKCCVWWSLGPFSIVHDRSEIVLVGIHVGPIINCTQIFHSLLVESFEPE